MAPFANPTVPHRRIWALFAATGARFREPNGSAPTDLGLIRRHRRNRRAPTVTVTCYLTAAVYRLPLDTCLVRVPGFGRRWYRGRSQWRHCVRSTGGTRENCESRPRSMFSVQRSSYSFCGTRGGYAVQKSLSSVQMYLDLLQDCDLGFAFLNSTANRPVPSLTRLKR